jgi:DNA-binding XRE family transcriptional regulator
LNIMASDTKRDFAADGAERYRRWREKVLSSPEGRRIYAEESAKKEMWLQLVEARQQAGLTQQELAERLGVSQAQVARLEKRGYDAYTLTSLRRYVEALGNGYRLDVSIQIVRPDTLAATPG